ncbi:Glyceraldehyde-3-phosphate dehydrogenase [Hordeum vulgare]|nr:Glyceraldehyde-3-phosphate dehydrogenase [Hordeum vulgare]
MVILWKSGVPEESNTMFKLKVGLIGFGSIGRQIAEALVDIKDVDLITICDELKTSDMSSKFSLRGSGGKSLMFLKKAADIVNEDGILVSVIIPREHEKTPWGYLPVNYVIDMLSLSSEDKSVAYSSHDQIDPPNVAETTLICQSSCIVLSTP